MIRGGGPWNLVPAEVVDAGLVAFGEERGDVATHIVFRVLGLAVDGERVEQRVGVRNIIAHGGEDLIRVVWQPRRLLRLLLEAFDHIRVLGIHLDHTELAGLLDRLANAGHSELGARFDVLVHHLLEVQAIDVISPDNHHDVRLDIFDDVDRLVHGVR